MATAQWFEPLFINQGDFTAVASTASEATLISGTNKQPKLWAGFWDASNRPGRSLVIKASGVISCTGTPTITFQLRLGSTQGVTNYSGTSVGVSAAVTMQSGITNQYWELEHYLTARTLGDGTGNTSMSGAGKVLSPGGFASPFTYSLIPSQGALATWTSTTDQSLVEYFNLSVTWSASSGSNTITCKELFMYTLN